MSAERWSGHVLDVTLDDDGDHKWTVQCTTPEKCNGWTECGHPDGHDIPGDSAREDAEDEGEYTFHGVEHQYHSGWGWTVPFDGCVVADNVMQWCPDSAEEIAAEYGVGRHRVDDEWVDDTDVVLGYIDTLRGDA